MRGSRARRAPERRRGAWPRSPGCRHSRARAPSDDRTPIFTTRPRRWRPETSSRSCPSPRMRRRPAACGGPRRARRPRRRLRDPRADRAGRPPCHPVRAGREGRRPRRLLRHLRAPGRRSTLPPPPPTGRSAHGSPTSPWRPGRSTPGRPDGSRPHFPPARVARGVPHGIVPRHDHYPVLGPPHRSVSRVGNVPMPEDTRVGVRGGEPTQAGTFEGTWIYANRDAHYAMWIRTKDGKPQVRLQYQSLANPESFETDWDGPRELLHGGEAGVVLAPARRGRCPGARRPLGLGALRRRAPRAARRRASRCSARGYGRTLSMNFKDYQRIITAGPNGNVLRAPMTWTWVKVSKRELLWDETALVGLKALAGIVLPRARPPGPRPSRSPYAWSSSAASRPTPP